MHEHISAKALLFDMDGVLVDSTPVVERSWRKWAKANKIDQTILMPLIHGRKALETIAQVAPHLDAYAEWQILIKQESEDTEGLRSFDGAKTLLEALNVSPLLWAIVTSAPRQLAIDRLKATGLPVPPVLICAEDIDKGKPAPDGYLAAAKALDVLQNECLVIEDAPSGIEAALSAGMKALAITSTHEHNSLKKAHYCVASIEDVKTTGSDVYVNSIRS